MFKRREIVFKGYKYLFDTMHSRVSKIYGVKVITTRIDGLRLSWCGVQER